MKSRNLLVLPLLLMTACSPTAGDSASSTGTGEPIASCPEQLRFAVTDILGEERLQEEFGAFQVALGEVLGVPIELFPVSSQVAATPALMFDRIDIALAGPSEYVLMNAQAEAVPLVGLTRPDYYTVIVGVTGTEMTSIEDLRGKTIGIREEGSTAGHLGVLKMLKDAGMELNEDFTIEVIGDDSGLAKLQEGRVDAWAGGLPHYKQVLSAQELNESDFVIIAEGEQLPNDVFVVNPSLDEACVEEMRSRIVEQEQKLIEAILAAPANQKYAESEIVPANDQDYELIREGYKAIGQEDYL
ncbi:MAG: PhnD/SsuA/transferrin family substrate-binding protein [Spirulinaceae cyanobacterium RM2_2_10]|nr:PhnD/SsuA/transferrin family substrate-binding protein [Spirulinaceae cyanobacterium SM2_1_0]NJO20386.1 PhnD/SsuA/transferrin family substrate-binding protein [Spirulinaceae cyanobacterium RM2_2_10]